MNDTHTAMETEAGESQVVVPNVIGYLVIDTESSDVFDFKLPADAEGQPRLAELVMIQTDLEFNQIALFCYYIKPDGWSMAPGASAINGLTNEFLTEHGRPVSEALETYVEFIDSGYAVVAHHAQFDCKIMRGELRRAKYDDRFHITHNVCTMRAMTGICQTPQKNGRGYKWPKLDEAYRYVSRAEPPEGGHKAERDAFCCLDIARYLRNFQQLPAPCVHFAQGRS